MNLLTSRKNAPALLIIGLALAALMWAAGGTFAPLIPLLFSLVMAYSLAAGERGDIQRQLNS
ncbi:hypothetical protein [Dermatophilus congolensis]|uniref:Uncharacterized protein n=1 Tax=Dermatophilus congolensis TaxID=1863 RepID=A0A239V8X7_9MICO|nr:hypothetical protein [Dermatophilus congolensis]MBO3130535.1 hypothetical protein [Dermatophilus congolensis]MBO3130835.1 hypothetical protein [Dermatophilus congolensis]MBO3135007.1 hypothetical protein [Dermatophilus congolensis]MBO3137246.1 hypothetical protein [Dermatophilus congolensis]MBO3139491.1 hypothetical protein [Dermatophilus congolensis]